MSSSGSQILTAPTSRARIHEIMLSRASQSSRFGARLASRIAIAANPASSRIVRKARPMRPCWSPISTQTTHTSAAAMSAPIAIQMAPRMSRDVFGPDFAGVVVFAMGSPSVVPSSSHAGRR